MAESLMCCSICIGWNMEGFFFIIQNIAEHKTQQHLRKSISSGYIIPKIIFNKKKCSKLLKTKDFAQTSGFRSKTTQTAKIHSQTRKSVLQPGIPGSRYLDPGLRTQIPGSRYQDPLEDLKTLSGRENSNFRALKTTLCDQF